MARTPRSVVVAFGVLAVIAAVDLVAARALNQLLMSLPGIDKLLHLLFHAVLFACVRSLAASRGLAPHRQTAVAVVACVLFGIVVELVQGLSPYRSFDVGDVAANAAGVALGWVAVVRPSRRLAGAVVLVAVTVVSLATYRTYAGRKDFLQGIRYSQQGDFVTAREHFRRAYDSGLRTASLYNELGWVEIESGIGDADRAVAFAKVAFEMTPQNPDILDTYGWALHHAGRSAEALPLLLDAYRMKPEMFCIHYHLGSVYLTLGQVADADRHFRQQLEKPKTREARLARQALDELARHR